MDAGHTYAEKRLRELERKLNREYRRAYKDLRSSTRRYGKHFSVMDAKKKELLKQGLITPTEYKNWRYNKIFHGEQWKAQSNMMMDDYLNRKAIADEMIKDTGIDVYALNFNYGTYEVETAVDMVTGFTLYDKNTVRHLMKDDPLLLRPMGFEARKAVAAGKIKRWGRQKLQSVAMQGIVQGESIPKIADRMAKSLSTLGRNAALRDARTMVTAAENGGRLDSYRRAEDLGIAMNKQWVATEDGRTRETHRELDGVSIPVDEEFDNGLMYPADPIGDASEVYNCRCTLIADVDSNQESGNAGISEMSFDEWEEFTG